MSHIIAVILAIILVLWILPGVYLSAWTLIATIAVAIILVWFFDNRSGTGRGGGTV